MGEKQRCFHPEGEEGEEGERGAPGAPRGPVGSATCGLARRGPLSLFPTRSRPCGAGPKLTGLFPAA